jgi:hypothetical protein
MDIATWGFFSDKQEAKNHFINYNCVSDSMDARLFVFLLLGISVAAAASPYLVIVDSTTMRYTLSGSDFTFMNETKAGLDSFVDSSAGQIGIIYTDDCDTWGDVNSGGVRLIQPFTSDKAALHTAISGMEDSKKKSSLGTALLEAKSYLESSGQKANIVLMAYDLGSCDATDPEAVASEIYNNGNGVGKLSVIGFMGSGGDGEKAAKALAAAGGGKYYHMDSEGDAAKALAGIPQISGPAGSSTSGASPTEGGTTTGSKSPGICPVGFALLPLAAIVFLRQRSA